MSLILGLHLLNKLYLVSDTRVTKTAGNSETHEDNQLKFEAINPKISVVVAGNGHQAAFIVSELKKIVGKEKTISDLETFLAKDIKEIASNYIASFNNPSLSAFIFTGFTDKQGKTVNSSTLGNVMSGAIRKYGAMQQSVHKEITKSLVSEISRKGVLQKNDPIEIDVRGSKMLSLELDTRNNSTKVRQIECYEYAMFYPGYQSKPLPIPDDITSLLEFRNISGNSTEDVLYKDAEILINFVNGTARENNFTSVGGHVIPILQSFDTGVIFLTGDLAQIKNGQIVKTGSLYVEDGKICYELPNGQKGVYNKVESLLEPTRMKLFNTTL